MSEKEALDPSIHAEAALLPWYANGTLSGTERQQVARHIESCTDCFRQLEEIKQIRSHLLTFYEAQPSPSPDKAQAILKKVAREASARRQALIPRASWHDRVDSWFRTLFLAQWVPTLAATLIFVQLGLLTWLTMPQAPSDQITTRSLGSPTITFKVTFQETTTEKQIRELLSEVRGKITSGPSPDHIYLVEVVGGSEAITIKMLNTLRAKPEVVRTVEVATD
jgi:anti-sigma-K factor RskA